MTPRDTAGLSDCIPWHYTSVRGSLHVTPRGTAVPLPFPKLIHVIREARDPPIPRVTRLSTKSGLAKKPRRFIYARSVQNRVLHEQGIPASTPRTERNESASYIFPRSSCFHSSSSTSIPWLKTTFQRLFLTSAMSALLGRLPPELLVDILTRLDSTSQKAFRCVSRWSCGSVTSLLFNELFFDFDVGGTEGLVAISNYPHLAKHVRTIVLQRRNSLRKLDDFRAWQQATVYEYEAYAWEGEFKWLKGVMSQSEWENMTEKTRRALFDEYNSDYAAITRRTTQLAVAMSSNIYTDYKSVPAT